MTLKEEIGEIVGRDNVANFHYTNSVNGKTVITSQFNDKQDKKIESTFDSWFLGLQEVDQKKYLEDLQLLEDDFNTQFTDILGGIKVDIVQMYSKLFEDILQEINSQLTEVDYLVQDLELGSFEGKEKQLTDLKELRTDLEERQKWCWEQSVQNPTINIEYPLQSKNIEIVGKKQYYRNDMHNYGHIKLESALDNNDGTYTIQYKPFTDSAPISKNVPSHELAIFKYGLFLDPEGMIGYADNLEKEKKYLEKRTLSHQEFISYFDPHVKLKQSESIGDCYLIAGMNGMRQMQSRETMLSRHIQITYDADSKIDAITVQLPIGSFPIKETFVIDKSCLNNEDLLSGSVGYKALEVAYLKLRAKRAGKDAHTGWLISDLDTDILTGGLYAEVANDFFGKIADSHNWFVSNAESRDDYNETMSFALTQFSPFDSIATVSSIEGGPDSLTDISGKEHKLYTHHAFTLIHVDANERWDNSYATLENPWDPDTLITIKLSDFAKFFDRIQFTKFNRNEMFKDN